MKDTNIKIIARLKTFLEKACEEKGKYCINEKAFKRDRLLTFRIVVFFIINLSKRSLNVELDELFGFLSIDHVAGKSAFSQARYKLKHQFFIDWNNEFVNAFYQEKENSLKDWKGFYIYGIDGSTLRPADNEGVRKEFGEQKNQSTTVPMARVMACYDVLNDICIASKLYKVEKDELGVALNWAASLPENSLSIYDRGFASFILVYMLTLQQKDFVIRCKTGFNNVVKAFVKSGKHSAIVDFPATWNAKKRLADDFKITIASNTTVKVRLVRVKLKSGETEVLITSLKSSKEYPTKCFKDLYFMRWGVEVYFDRLKNKLQLECFSGHKPEAIYQEFYAMIITSNLQSLIISDCEPELKKGDKNRKYEHKINRNVTLGFMKNRLIELFLSKDPSEILRQLKTKFLKNIVPIIPDRNEPRNKRKVKQKGKHKTVANYRRAV